MHQYEHHIWICYHPRVGINKLKSPQDNALENTHRQTQTDSTHTDQQTHTHTGHTQKAHSDPSTQTDNKNPTLQWYNNAPSKNNVP